MRGGESEAAVSRLRKTIAVEPDNGVARYHLDRFFSGNCNVSDEWVYLQSFVRKLITAFGLARWLKVGPRTCSPTTVEASRLWPIRCIDRHTRG